MAAVIASGEEGVAGQTLRPFLQEAASLQVQFVLYNTPHEIVRRACQSLRRAAEIAINAGVLVGVALRCGDCSAIPCLSPDEVEGLRTAVGPSVSFDHTFFGANLGSAAGNNRLAAGSGAQFLMMHNPDVVVSPRLLSSLLAPFRLPGIGITEAKQLPIEHPKDYDAGTGETSWASMACAIVPRALFEMLGGFDADTFFLYGDDVDFSWRVRLAGYKALFVPSALAFHDKRLSAAAGWNPSEAELYYSAESTLMMAHKWAPPARVDRLLEVLDGSASAHARRAAATYRDRRANGTLPQPVQDAGKVAQFVEGNYAPHRFML